MVVSIASDELTGVARILGAELRRRGHQVIAHGALALSTGALPRNGGGAGRGAGRSRAGADQQPAPGASAEGAQPSERGTAVRSAPQAGEDCRWAWAAEAAALDLVSGRAERAVLCCWTGTGVSIAANKVPGVRAALCRERADAEGARRWNDANALALSLRSTSEALLGELLDGFLDTAASTEPDDRANVDHLRLIERGGGQAPCRQR